MKFEVKSVISLMDHQLTGPHQVGYGTNPYRNHSMMPPAASTQVAYHQLQAFLGEQMHEIEQTVDFKTHSLPLARIKKIMKADENVKMISAEAPVVFVKACEMFILELTGRSWMHTEENKRRTLQKNDIAAAIGRTDIFDFLVDIVPRDEVKDDGGMVIPRAAAAAMPLVDPISIVDNFSVPSSCYYVSPLPSPPPMGGVYVPLPPPQQMWPKAPAALPPHTTI